MRYEKRVPSSGRGSGAPGFDPHLSHGTASVVTGLLAANRNEFTDLEDPVRLFAIFCERP